MIWINIKYENKIILIGGVPGTGKTTIAVELAKKLEIEHIIHTDTIRNIMRYYETNPLLHEVSHTAWKYFGECNNKNIIKGFFKHAFLLNKVIKDLIQDIIKKGSSAIIEGVHITPLLSFLISEDIPIFILRINNKDDHLKIFDKKNNKRSIKNKQWYNNYENISVIQDKLVSLTKNFSHNVHLIENKNIETTLNKIISKHEKSKRMRLCC